MNKQEIVALDKDFWIIKDNDWGPGMYKLTLYFKGVVQSAMVYLKRDMYDKDFCIDYLLWHCALFNWEGSQ